MTIAEPRAVVNALEPERVYLCSFGEVVKHVPLCVVPRYPNMTPSGPSILVQDDEGLATASGNAAT